MSVQNSNGQSVVVWLLIAAIAARDPFAENGDTVMKFCWYWICLAAISSRPVSGVVIL